MLLFSFRKETFDSRNCSEVWLWLWNMWYEQPRVIGVLPSFCVIFGESPKKVLTSCFRVAKIIWFGSNFYIKFSWERLFIRRAIIVWKWNRSWKHFYLVTMLCYFHCWNNNVIGGQVWITPRDLHKWMNALHIDII